MTRVYDMIARVFAKEQVGVCFALLGDANMNFATRLAESGCDMIYVRHEHCAAAAAMAYARKTGAIGVATVTCGPGVTQLMTALPAAVRARIPMVIFAGEAPQSAAWYNQEIDQLPFVTATGAAYLSLQDPAEMLTAIRDAFVQARVEMRPIVVGVPFDIQNKEWPHGPALPAPAATILPKTQAIVPDKDQLAQAADQIAKARKIVIVGGLGVVASGAIEECKSLAAKTDGLLSTTLPARGLFHDDPFSIGIAGGFSNDVAREYFAQADLIIAIGCSLAKHNTDGGKLWPQADVLHLDIAPKSKNQGQAVAQYHLRADAKLGVLTLLEMLDPRQPKWRSPELAHQISTRPADAAKFPAQAGVHDPRDAVHALQTALPSGWDLVNSSGHCSYFTAQMPNRPQSRFLTIREFGAIGNGISFAMGVAALRRDDPVVLLDGDGSLLMHIQEIETLIRHRFKVLIIVLNDGAYGSEIHKLRADGLSDTGAMFGRPDFADIARGFGAKGHRISDLSDVPKLAAAFESDPCVTVWDIPISDQVASPPIRRAHHVSSTVTNGENP